MSTYKEEIYDSILNYDEDGLKEICQSVLDKDEVKPIDLVHIIGDIMSEYGDKFEKEEIMLPELIVVANIVKSAIDEIIDPAIRASGEKRETKGKIVIGTVESDIHSIGKDLVASFLFSNGFEVYNLGVDVPAAKFLEKAEEVNADIIGLSSLITLSLDFQKQVIDVLTEKGVRNKYKIIVGGAPTSADWAKKIGADAWADDSLEAVKKVNELLKK
jgi:methylmalonyl-CoA mutase cobalamin-binding domain/chain